jgi:hypothetical protein
MKHQCGLACWAVPAHFPFEKWGEFGEEFSGALTSLEKLLEIALQILDPILGLTPKEFPC